MFLLQNILFVVLLSVEPVSAPCIKYKDLEKVSLFCTKPKMLK